MIDKYPNPTHEDPSAPLTGELRKYDDGHSERIFKMPGHEFNPGALVQDLLNDPVAYAAGAVCVQTVRVVDGKPKRTRYYINPDGFLDGGTGRGAVDGFAPSSAADGSPSDEIYRTKVLNDYEYTITIGQPWLTPLGKANGVVEVVAVPYVAHSPETDTAGPVSFTAAGLEKIEAMVAATTGLSRA
jgi:hypothetical protein